MDEVGAVTSEWVQAGGEVEDVAIDVVINGREMVAQIVYAVEKEKWEGLGICLEFRKEV